MIVGASSRAAPMPGKTLKNDVQRAIVDQTTARRALTDLPPGTDWPSLEPQPIQNRWSDMAALTVFGSLDCQQENLGDLVIRREMIRWFDDVEAELHLYAGEMDPGIVEAVLEGRRAKIYRSRLHWEMALVKEAARHRAVLAFAPGPQLLTCSRASLIREFGNLVNCGVLATLRRPVLKVGRSIRGNNLVPLIVERLIFGLSAHYSVRDQTSVEVLGRPADVIPDMAMAMSPCFAGSSRRMWASFSPRTSRGWSLDELRSSVSALDALGLQSCLVSQTKFDEPFHAALARELRIDHVAWDRRSHDEQLLRVLRRYSESRIVVSDRLHGLILGLVHGATPIPRVIRNDDKLLPALGAIGWPESAPIYSDGAQRWIEWASSNQTCQERVVRNAKRSLVCVRNDLEQLIRAAAWQDSH